MQGRARRQVFRSYDATASEVADERRYCPRCGTACGDALTGGFQRRQCPACGYMHHRNPAPGVAVAVTESDRVLLGQRTAGARFGGKWAFPAGFIEFEEDFLTAARREVNEETGLTVEVTGILNVTFNYLSWDLHALVIAVAARVVGGEMTPGDELCDLRWVPLEGPYPPLAYEADAHLLEVMASGELPCLPVDPRYASVAATASRRV